MKNRISFTTLAVVLVIAFSNAHAEDLWLNVKDFGASVDAPPDSNARAIQRALDSLKWGMTLVFPTAGRAAAYSVDRKLVMDGKQYVTIRGFSSGLAQGGTRIAWADTGLATGNLLEITNSQYCNFEDLAFHGNSLSSTNDNYKTGLGFYIHGKQPDSTTGYSSTIRFHDCAFYYFDVAIQVGDTVVNEDNNENCVFTNCEIGFNNIGYRQYWPNAMRNDFYALTSCFNNNDFVFGTPTFTTGPNSIIGWATTGKVGTTSIILNNGVGLTITNVRVECAGKFIDFPPSGSSPVAEYITINNGEFHLIDSQPYIAVGAHLTAMNCSFGSWCDPDFNFKRPASPNAEWTFIGCHFNNPKIFDTTDNWLQGSAVKLTMLGCKGIIKSTGDWVHIADRIGVYNLENTRTFSDNSSTPNVMGYNFIKVANGSNTSITNFNGGHYQQIITLLFTNGNTTLVNGYLLLKNSTNVTPQVNNCIQLMDVGNNNWLEISRNF